jgi:hypothetical protein
VQGLLEWVGGAGDVAQLPVYFLETMLFTLSSHGAAHPLDAGDVEEHVHPGEEGRRGQGRQALNTTMILFFFNKKGSYISIDFVT